MHCNNLQIRIMHNNTVHHISKLYALPVHQLVPVKLLPFTLLHINVVQMLG